MKFTSRFTLPVLLTALPALATAAPPVAATIDTALSTAGKHVRQFAFDGDPETFFESKQAPTSADQFTIVFDRPVVPTSLAVVTGRPDGGGQLDAGTLEVSADGKAFDTLQKFTDGAVRAEWNGRPLQAVRIRPDADLDHPLAVREFTIESVPPVARFQYPIEFVVDVSDAPEMKEWAEKAARACERAYPMINEELKSEGYQPQTQVTMTLKQGYNGVAEAGGGRITGSVRFFKDHPDDVGAMVHETTHIVQNYPGRGNPSWLVEGVSDYVRFFKYEPGKIGPIDAKRARYNGSYRVTAAFLAYLSETYDKAIVLKLNKLMREGNYKEEIFKELTGKTVQELDEEWRATLRR